VAGFKGLKNGRLIEAAQLFGYRVLLTMDQGLPSESSPSGYTLAVIVLRARTNRMQDLVPLVPIVIGMLRTIGPGETMIVG
jgi:hypothetical protein